MIASAMTRNRDHQRPSHAHFATTHWSVVLAAGNRADSHCAEALQTLCETYWVPLYAYARQHGHSAPDAEDLTQSFLIKVIEKNLMQRADRERGRFRSFLLTAFKNFCADVRDKDHTRNRGGQARVFSLDFGSAETRYQRELATKDNGDRVFEHQWALTVLETVMKQLRERYESDGKIELFEALQPCLMQASGAIDYAALADQLALKKGALRVAVHRLRKRYRDLLRTEIGHTVAHENEIEDEIRHLFKVLANQ